jgi:hypothetical protein
MLTFGISLLRLGVNLAALMILVGMAVVVNHTLLRILLVVAACGAALATTTSSLKALQAIRDRRSFNRNVEPS